MIVRIVKVGMLEMRVAVVMEGEEDLGYYL